MSVFLEKTLECRRKERFLTDVWDFRLFEEYSLEDAVGKSCEREYERARFSQLPILQEIDRPGWKGWESMPGAALVQELIKRQDAEISEFRGQMWYPVKYSCPYVWEG